MIVAEPTVCVVEIYIEALLYVKADHGEEAWLALLEQAGFSRSPEFLIQEAYPDELLFKVAEAAAANCSSDTSGQNFLRYCGRCFVRSASFYDYEKIIKVT